MSDASWRPLPFTIEGIPNLLVSTSFKRDSYTVHLTDLAHIWTEKLSRKAIFHQATGNEVTIDVTEGPDQLQRLLELLQAAFDPSKKEHKTTSLRLSTETGKDLKIDITCDLPKPLWPLKWVMHMKKQPSAAVATELVLPLIQAQLARAQEVKALLATIRDKDGVIEKLADKVEASIGLENVFTILSGKRKVTRAVAEARIKGLAPFRRQDGVTQPEAADGVPNLLENVFGGKGFAYTPDTYGSVAEDWWTTIGKGAGKSATRSAPIPARKKFDTRDNDDDDDDDDFQVQATPPHLMSTAQRKAERDGDETVSSDGGDGTVEIPDSVPLHPSFRASPPKPPKSKESRLGAIARHKTRSPSTSPPAKESSPPPPKSKPSAKPIDDDETASEDEPDSNMISQDLTSSPPPRDPSPPPKEPSLPPPRRGLGRIGGKAKASSPPPDKASWAAPDNGETSAAPTPKRRLGAIGKRANAADSPSPTRASTRRPSPPPVVMESSPPKEPTPEPEPEETAEERSARRRAELQQELQKKAAAGPAKKKRRF